MTRVLSLVCLLALSSLTVFANKKPKSSKNLNGKWQLIEIQEITYLPNRQLNIITQSSNNNSNIKEYKNKGLTFKSYNYKNELILEGEWTIGNDRLVENVTYDQTGKLNGALNVFEFEIIKDKLIIKYNVACKNNVFINEIWKKIK